MRILVGTLYTIENEFEECCASIKNQTYRNVEHVVIQGLPNKEAHDTLYRTFEQRAAEFDIMIKVDADMVIENHYLFDKIVSRFEADPQLSWLCLQVHDFYCNRLIWGLNVFRNTIRWLYRGEELFVDHNVDQASVTKRQLNDPELTPAAIHSKNPGPFQAFHFGFHRGQKCVQPGRIYAKREVLQWKLFRDVLVHYRKTGDVRLAYALAGFEQALTGRHDDTIVSFENSFLRDLFEAEFVRMTAGDLQRYIGKKQRQRMAALPYPLDFCVAYGLQRLLALIVAPRKGAGQLLS
jgi:hypothetical protein